MTDLIQEPDPSLPLHPALLEFVRLKDGQEFVLASTRVAHAIDGKLISGFVVAAEGVTDQRKLIPYKDVVKHRAMNWISDTSTLAIDEVRMPRSLFK